jgi:recombination protein RecA
MSKADALRKTVNAAMGGEVLKMGSDPTWTVEYLPTGVLPIDILTNGGLPKGRFTQIIGDYSTLKSYVGLRAIATTQAAGGTCALIDTEHSYDSEWAQELGVDTKNLIVWPNRDDPDRVESGEIALDVAEGFIRGGADLIVFDSIAATLPQAQRTVRLHGENVQPGRLAALMSLAMRKLTAANSYTAVLWVNQLRTNVGVTFGNPDVPTGGKAPGYYNSYILKVKKAGKLTEPVKVYNGEKHVAGKRYLGQRFIASMEKSKLSAPHRELWFDFMTDGVDEVGFLVTMGLEVGAVKNSGNSWWIDGGRKKVVGREKFKTWLRSDPKIQEVVKKKVLEACSLGHLALPSSKVTPPRSASSARKAPASTRGRAPAASRSTGRRKTS